MKRQHILWIFIIVIGSFSCKSTKVSADEAAAKQNMQRLERQAEQYQSQVEDLNAQLASKDARINELAAENQRLNSEMNVMRAALADVTEQMQESSDDYGVWFRVQIGAYQQKKVDENLKTTDKLGLEGDDLQKIVLGRFRNYDDAKRLQTQLQSVGLKDAWIVSYKEGVRVPIEEVRY